MMQFEPKINWDLDRDLYERMKQDASLILENTAMYNFYNEREASNFKDFYLVKEQLRNLNDWTSINSTIQLVDSFIRNNMFQIMENDSFQRTGLYVDSVLLNANLVLHHLTDSLIVINDSLHTLILNTRNENLSDIREYNQDIATTAEFEENERLVNEVALATVEQGIYELSNEQKGILESLIFECPAKGGRAVYIARSLYRLVNDTLTYKDDSICKAQAISWRVANPKTVTPKEVKSTVYTVIVYPNPAKSDIFFELNKTLSNNADIVIYNSLGQIMTRKNLVAKNKLFSVNVQPFSAGVYYYHFTEDNKTITTGKFVVEK